MCPLDAAVRLAGRSTPPRCHVVTVGRPLIRPRRTCSTGPGPGIRASTRCPLALPARCLRPPLLHLQCTDRSCRAPCVLYPSYWSGLISKSLWCTSCFLSRFCAFHHVHEYAIPRRKQREATVVPPAVSAPSTRPLVRLCGPAYPRPLCPACSLRMHDMCTHFSPAANPRHSLRRGVRPALPRGARGSRNRSPGPVNVYVDSIALAMYKPYVTM
jgi:hypothetical protein